MSADVLRHSIDRTGPSLFDDLRATVVGGLAAGLILPFALVGAVLFEDGPSSITQSDLLELGVFVALGSAAGFVMAIGLGFPALIVLRWLKWDRSRVLALAGAVLALAFGLAFLSAAPVSVVVIVTIVGCVCGLVTGRLRKNTKVVESPVR